MARFRAVVTIQPPGFGGTPVSGHLWTATTKASCTASSATSRSPKRRVRAATARPNSSRKVASTSAVPTATGSVLGVVLEGAHLHRALAGGAALGRPPQGVVEVLGLDDPEAAHVLLRLGEGPVAGENLVPLGPHHGGHVGRL